MFKKLTKPNLVERSKTINFVVLLFVIIFLSGCSFKDTLKNIDNQIGEFFNDFEDVKDETVLDFSEEVNEEDKEEVKEQLKENLSELSNLSKEQKLKIDEWLKSKNLDSYGDDIKGLYQEATPLFDKERGSIDRYEYLLNKFPEIMEII